MKKKNASKSTGRKRKQKQAKRQNKKLRRPSKISTNFDASLWIRKTQRPAAKSKFKKSDLPFSYNETKLAVLVRDPYWAYSYWDFSANTWDWIVSMRQREPNSYSVLRIHEIDGGSSYDLAVNLEVKNWYVHLGKPGKTFEFELGLMDPHGKFHSIARSNRIRTPRDRPSDVIDPEWDAREFDEIYRLSGGGQTGRGSELSSRAQKQ